MATLRPRWAAGRSLMPALDTLVVDVENSLRLFVIHVGSGHWQSLRLQRGLKPLAEPATPPCPPRFLQEAVLVSLLLSLLG